MKSIELLREEAARKRIYRTSSNIFDKIDSLAALFQQRHPETDWGDCRELLTADDPGTGNYDFAVRHLIKWGKADARIIEDAFQISLPPCVHELYSQIQEAILIWRNIFYLPPPAEVVAWERQNREWEGRDPYERPVRLVRFIRCECASGDIALSRNDAVGGKRRGVHLRASGSIQQS